MKDIEQIIKNTPRVTLAPTEKALMRERLSAFASTHPIGSVLSPISVQTLGVVSSRWMVIQKHYVMVTLVLLLLVGGGVSALAETALPGDPLYGVKTGFNEQVTGVFALTPEAKVKHESDLVSKRLSEAASLSAEGRLTTEARSQIEDNFTKHIENISANIDKLENQDSRQAVVANSDLETSIDANVQVFDSIPHSTKEILDLTSFLRQQLTAVSEQLSLLESTVSSNEVSVEAETSAHDNSIEAENRLNEARNLLETSRDSISPEAYDDINGYIALSTEVLASGYTKIQSGLYNKAFVLFQRSMSYSREAELVLKTRLALNLDTNQNQTGNEIGTTTEDILLPVATTTPSTTPDLTGSTTPISDISDPQETAGTTTPSPDMTGAEDQSSTTLPGININL